MASQPKVSLQERANPYGWVLAVMGIASIVFGALAVVWPGPTLQALVYLFGAFVAVSGILALVATYQAAKVHEPWWPALFIAIADLVAAVVVFTYPGLTTTVLVYCVALWAICVGVVEMFASLVTARFLWLVAGLLALALGFVLLANPQLGGLALMITVGIFAIVWGIVLVIDAIRAPRVMELRVF